MVPSVKKVTPADNYLLFVVFENGEQGWLDLKPILDFGIFRKIKDDKAFRRVRVAFDTIAWDCGADLDPEYVYAKCQKE